MTEETYQGWLAEKGLDIPFHQRFLKWSGDVLTGDLGRIIQDDAVMIQPLFRPLFSIVRKTVKGLELHPTNYHQFNKVWIS